MYISLLF